MSNLKIFRYNSNLKLFILSFFIISLIFLFTSVSLAEKDYKTSEKKRMPVLKEKTSAKEHVNNKEAKENGKGSSEESDKESETDKKDESVNKKEEKKDKDSVREDVRKALEDFLGNELGKEEEELVEIWESLLEEGYSVKQIKDVLSQNIDSIVTERKGDFSASVISQGMEKIIKAQGSLSNLQKALIAAYVTKVLGKFNQGFYSYWVEQAQAKGFNYVKEMLYNHYELESYVEDLIGNINYLDDKYKDNGFISYWAEQARQKGLAYVKQHLGIWKELLPYIEEVEGKQLDLFNPEDSGIVDYWASEVEKLMNGGSSLEDAIEEIITQIQGEDEIPDELKEALIPFVEDLLDVTFDEENGQHMGFLTYWSEKIINEENTLEEITTLLGNMVQIKDEVEALIGQIDFLDDDASDDGFISYWAENLFNDNVNQTEILLDAMNQILSEIEALIGEVNLLDGNHDDNGFLTYWAKEAVNLGDVNKIKQRLYIWDSLIPEIEIEEGNLDLFSEEDTGIISYWTTEVENRVDNGMTLENAIQEVIDLIHQEEPITYSELIPYIEDLLEVTFDEENGQHMGFLTYWSEKIINEENTLEEITTLLGNMVQIKDEVEALIGQIDFLDDDASDDGFISYWAEYANDVGIDYVKRLLGYMSQIKPNLETLAGNIDLLDNDYKDNGLLTYWAEFAENNGIIQTNNIIDNMVSVLDEVEALIGQVDFYDNQYGDNGFLTYWAEYALDIGVGEVENLLTNMIAVKEKVENLIGPIDFFDNDYSDNGFITFWAEYAAENGIQKAKDILDSMNAILTSDWDSNGTPDIEELIGAVEFFDNQYGDNGFLTYWAEVALEDGINSVKQTLYIWKRLLPYVEDNEGKELDLFNPEDSGIVSYWAGEVERLMDEEGMSLEEAIDEVIEMLSS